MNIKNFFLIIIILVSGFSQTISAQKIHIGASGVYSFENQTVKKGLGYQFSLIYKTQKRIAILSTLGQYKETAAYPDFQYVSSDPYSFNSLNTNKSYLLPGDFSVTWFELSPIFYLFENSSRLISIYAGVGFGLYYPENKWNWNTHSSLHASQEQYGLIYSEDKMEPNLSYNFRTTFNISVTSNSYFCFETKYVFYKPTLSYEIDLPDSDDSYYGNRKINLNTFFISISLMMFL